ncbi:MAG: hypothetical protein A3D26_04075 [Candidatus Blackburnbacteria bacterium RIFCSPHIGHO2_02_FULL_44_20]|uniref:CMP/dCMP-type deaminase domain-containing protein n=1 Tax=Candidatus Blackburnbacteria bacterium RIFCSPHIGHO2_02_FULL_44_20 TaxID=1797516 RepID=A0A1G1V9T8_9BACT|nr:MAG: hypothetical protein A3D26_04075 [Candidatus Blackburnbacteria bacterium RIFCSPHIGHO2_02_FULL_44_20]
MKLAIELSDTALSSGELPFGAVVVMDGKIISESGNKTRHKQDVSRHAEIEALTLAQKFLSPEELMSCTLYSTVEPCPMCSFVVRELKLKRVVFAMPSPVMGGYSKFPILKDEGLSTNIPKYFGPPPEVVDGVLEKEAEAVWQKREELKALGKVK